MDNLYNLCRVNLLSGDNIVVKDEQLYLKVINYIINHPKETEAGIGEIAVTGIIHCKDIEEMERGKIKFTVEEYALLGYGGKKQTLEKTYDATAVITKITCMMADDMGIDVKEAAIIESLCIAVNLEKGE